MFALVGYDSSIHFFLEIALALIASAWISKKFGLLSALMFCVLSANALIVSEQPMSPYQGQDAVWIEALATCAGGTLSLILITLLAVDCISIKNWLKFFRFIAISNAWVMIVEKFFMRPEGLLFNASMSGCFSACLIPILFAEDAFAGFSLIPVVVSIFIAQKSQPVAVLFVVLGALMLQKRRFKALLGCLFIAPLAGVLASSHGLFFMSGRNVVWQFSFDYWFAQANQWLGIGLGSYYKLGPYILKDAGIGQVFLWLHSDWLQIIFELGFIGLGLAVLTYLGALYRVRFRADKFCALAAYGAFMFANFPLHLPLSAFFAVFLMRWAFETAPKGTRRLQRNYPE